MALGDALILDDAFVEVGGTEISDAVKTCKLTVTHMRKEVPHTFGKDGAIGAVSDKYSWSVDFDFVIDDPNGAGIRAVIIASNPPAA